MKILHITEKSRFSGAEILMRDLVLSHISNNDIAIASINPTEDDFKETMRVLELIGIQLFIPNHPLAKLQRIAHLFKVFRKYKPDVVVGHSAIVSVYMRAVGVFFPKIKKVIVLHAAADYECGGRLQKAEYLLQHFTDYVIGVSDWSANTYMKRFKSVPCKVIYNGVDLTKFTTSNLQSRDDIRKNVFNIRKSDFVILQVGRVNKVKNQMLTLQAFSFLALKMRQNVKLVFAGIIEDKQYYKKILRFCKENNLEEQILFLGARNDISKLLYASDLYVMPSERENFSIAILEALSSGIPIIYSDITQFSFLDKYKFKNTYKVSLENINSYTKLIISIIIDNRLFVERDLSTFSFDRCSNEYLKLFNELIK